MASGEWRRLEGHTKDQLSLGWRNGTHCDAGPTFELHFLPANPWLGGWAQVAVNGKAITGAKAGEYLPIHRQWSPGDVTRLHMEMPVQVVQANPQVADDAGRVAVQRGPLVYCMEELDQPTGVMMSDLALDLGQEAQAQFQSEMKTDLLGGVVVVRHTGVADDRAAARNALYSRYSGRPVPSRQVPLTFIPLRLVKSTGDFDASVDSQTLMPDRETPHVYLFGNGCLSFDEGIQLGEGCLRSRVG